MGQPISFSVCVAQLAGVRRGSEHGWAEQQEQQPPEEEATMAETGHPNHPADTGWHASAQPGEGTELKSMSGVKGR